MASPADPNRATNDLLRRVPPHSVEAEQADIAHEIFERLMGDEVEPRRDFIQTNALSVANLDV